MTNKRYKGLREDGQWEEFEASDGIYVTPENTGYEKVIDAETEEEIN
jgi:hypothetical protein